VARKSRQSFLKRLKEVKRMEKAAIKRERRLARKNPGEELDPDSDLPEREDGHDPGEPRPTVVLGPPPSEND